MKTRRWLETLTRDLRSGLRRSSIAGAIVLLLAAGGVATRLAQKAESDASVIHVLFLGNSYTYFNDLPAIFTELAKAGNQQKVDAMMVAPGGVRLKDHWDKAEAHAALNLKKWNYVVLQDQSTLGIGYYLDGNPRVTTDEIFLPYAKKWAAEIIQHGARPVFYLTWTRKATPDDQVTLNYAYIRAAKETGAVVAPVGLAWQQIRQQNPSIELYYKDGAHPSQAGSYLAACVMYATIFHHSPADLPSHITGIPVNLDTEKLEPDKTAVLVDLPSSEAQVLQAAAWEARESLQQDGGYPDVHPGVPPALTFALGEPLSIENVAGSWNGEMLFYPGVGPVKMMLQFRSDGGHWKGHLNIDYPVKDFAAESIDLDDLQVGKQEFTFSDPKSAGVDNWRVAFRGAYKGEELYGTAEAKSQNESPPTIVLGDWKLHKQNP